MKTFDMIIIGFGKGGKTLASAFAGSKQRVALIERSKSMFGGTCINVACIPTKALEHSARLSAAQGGSFDERATRYKIAVQEKRDLTAKLRQKNYEKLTDAGVEIIVGEASFMDSHKLFIALADGSTDTLYGEQIIIDTGASPFIPPIPGLKDSKFVYTSESMMEQERLPEQLIIIGGGYIGLEFASYYTNFGSKVTILQDGEAFIPREDAEVAASVLDSLQSRGIHILRKVTVQSVEDEGNTALVTIERDGVLETLSAQAVLVATGRRPNITGLNLDKAGVMLTNRGAVQVDTHLRTSVPHIWAVGDVTGGLQFTYISLDDSRIVRSQLLQDAVRSTNNRGAVPYTVFIDPPLSRIGFTEKEAIQQGYRVKIARLHAAAIPKAQILRRPTGLLKAVIDVETNLILGAHLFCADSHEIINLIKLAMDEKVPYKTLQDAIYTHPTMSEALNDLFSMIS